MDEPRWLTPDELDTWRYLASLTLFLPGGLEEALQCHGLNFFEYSVLAGLSDAPHHTMTMSSLAHLSNGSVSRLSHAAKRLEKRGWIQRHTSPDDGRVTLATLTEAGHAKLVAAAPDHVESVRRSVFDVLTEEQVAQLGEICNTLVKNINPVPAPWEHAEPKVNQS